MMMGGLELRSNSAAKMPMSLGSLSKRHPGFAITPRQWETRWKMRMAADRKFIDASHPGIYHYKRPEPQMRTLMQKLKGE
jgi:hypothetical protein